MAGRYLFARGKHLAGERRQAIESKRGIESCRFSGKIGDYLLLKGFQEVFVKLGIIEANEEAFFNDFPTLAG